MLTCRSNVENAEKMLHQDWKVINKKIQMSIIKTKMWIWLNWYKINKYPHVVKQAEGHTKEHMTDSQNHRHLHFEGV